jgi:hypothetical protein
MPRCPAVTPASWLVLHPENLAQVQGARCFESAIMGRRQGENQEAATPSSAIMPAQTAIEVLKEAKYKSQTAPHRGEGDTEAMSM